MSYSIQAYANLEQALCRLFARVSGTTDETAGIIFFRITSFRVRNTIIEKLFRKHFEGEYAEFRNSLIRQLDPIDRERNEIVHWNGVSERVDDEPEVISMRPPTFFTTLDFSVPRKTLLDAGVCE